MVEAEVREALQAGKAKTEIQIAFSLRAGLFTDRKQFADEARVLAWTRLRSKVRDGLALSPALRVVRESKAHLELAAIGPIGDWRTFLESQKELVADEQLVVRRYWTPFFVNGR